MSVSGKNTISFLWNKVLTLYNKLSSRITTLENSTGGGTGAYYCTCSTSGTTLAKVATCEDTSFTLKKGVEINVYFTYTNSSTSAITLNVNSTGAIRVMFTNGSSSGYYKIISASVCKFIYDGTYWRLVGGSVRADSDSTSSGSFSSSSKNYVTERDVYYGTPTINGSKSYSSNTTIYAPTSTGASGYILQSSGSGAPTWVSPKTITSYKKLMSGIMYLTDGFGAVFNVPTSYINSMSTDFSNTCGCYYTFNVSSGDFYILVRIIGAEGANNTCTGAVDGFCVFAVLSLRKFNYDYLSSSVITGVNDVTVKTPKNNIPLTLTLSGSYNCCTGSYNSISLTIMASDTNPVNIYDISLG